jgi:hypothetical protein
MASHNCCPWTVKVMAWLSLPVQHQVWSQLYLIVVIFFLSGAYVNRASCSSWLLEPECYSHRSMTPGLLSWFFLLPCERVWHPALAMGLFRAYDVNFPTLRCRAWPCSFALECVYQECTSSKMNSWEISHVSTMTKKKKSLGETH